MAKILVVDDDFEALLLLKTLLIRLGHQPLLLSRANNLPEQIERALPDLVILDLMMPGIMGGMAYDVIRAEVGLTLPIIVSSGTNIRLRAKNDPLLRYCPKPVEAKHLAATIDELLKLAEEAELDEPDHTLPGANSR